MEYQVKAELDSSGLTEQSGSQLRLKTNLIEKKNTSEIHEVTYSELDTLITNQGLVQGDFYKITDYKTKHFIPTETMSGDFSVGGGPGGVVGGSGLVGGGAPGAAPAGPTEDINEGDVEPLICLAMASDLIATQVFSEIYPEDYIEYDFYNNYCYNYNEPRNGFITKRIDYEFKNECPYDHRVVKFRRWDLDLSTFDIFAIETAYSKGDKVVYDNSGTLTLYYCTKDVDVSNTTSPDLDSSHWNWVIDKSDKWAYRLTGNAFGADPLNEEIILIDADPESYEDFETFSYGDSNNVIKPVEEGHMLILNNIIFKDGNCYNNNIGYGCYSMTFSANCSDNVFGNYCHSNTFGQNSSFNEFGNICYGNVFKETCQYNKLEDGCNGNTFNDNCSDNVLENGCYSNILGQSCQLNTFGDDCYSNTSGTNCKKNIFENECYSNTFGENCQSNILGNECTSNTFGTNCQSNTFGDECDGNTFGDNCSNNVFGNDCTSNTFGATCNSNTLKNGCVSNVFNDTCMSNTLNIGCEDNTFGTLCRFNEIAGSDNTFGNVCMYNKIGYYSNANTLGNNSSLNILENNVSNGNFGTSPIRRNHFKGGLDLDTIDFASATHVFGNYNCDVYSDVSGTVKLTYIDAMGSLAIASVND